MLFAGALRDLVIIVLIAIVAYGLLGKPSQQFEQVRAGAALQRTAGRAEVPSHFRPVRSSIFGVADGE